MSANSDIQSFYAGRAARGGAECDRRDHVSVTQPKVALRAFTPAELEIVEPWFRDRETRRFLGGPRWPAQMLAQGERAIGNEYRGAVQTGAHRYLAWSDGRAFGYVDCGIFDRCAVCSGEGPDGPIITDSIEVVTGSIAFAVDPQRRRQGLGRAMITALTRRPELGVVELFEAGIEPQNTASRRCLEAVGFRLRSREPDFEGMLYYQAWRSAIETHAAVSG